MSYIYKITNLVNQKVYIGKTDRTIAERWREHKKDVSRTDFQHRPLYLAIKKYGIENFVIEPLEECSQEEASEREIFWIEHYGSYKNGYNASIGGEGRAYIDYDLVYRTYLECKSFSKTAQITGHDRQVIAEAIKARGLATYERCASLYKPVAKLDKDTKEVLEVFASVTEAQKKYPSASHIAAVCKGKRKTSGGFSWKYI